MGNRPSSSITRSAGLESHIEATVIRVKTSSYMLLLYPGFREGFRLLQGWADRLGERLVPGGVRALR